MLNVLVACLSVGVWGSFSLKDGTKLLAEVDEPENSNALVRVARPATGQMVLEANYEITLKWKQDNA
ncbi:hypothetical protein [Nostoc sp. NMS4]|uniref:hypothetical protein n=1 Tax=Nostoc sp. NMS4 TaxID=2815390 RepID=UPI0025DE238B|nr:hypothetical protein [Nostoc sp. NMS4]MBN3924671.1 hypothetical protein [Nostoc sp. NMS4]